MIFENVVSQYHNIPDYCDRFKSSAHSSGFLFSQAVQMTLQQFWLKNMVVWTLLRFVVHLFGLFLQGFDYTHTQFLSLIPFRSTPISLPLQIHVPLFMTHQLHLWGTYIPGCEAVHQSMVYLPGAKPLQITGSPLTRSHLASQPMALKVFPPTQIVIEPCREIMTYGLFCTLTVSFCLSYHLLHNETSPISSENCTNL